MKNVVLVIGVGLVVLALYKNRRTTGTVTATDPVEIPGPNVGYGGGSDMGSECSLCTSVSNTLGTVGQVSASPQIDSPAADAVFSYAIERTDFTGNRMLAV